jgi:hypothetical protein
MIVRLAFSVAVNVDADILIVDEALAVGDAIFQHRCFRKIREMQADGKTILYVGHDTEAVRNLCTSALLLDGGRIIERGDPNYVVNKYYALITDRERAYSEGNLIEHGEFPGEGYETVFDFIQNLNATKIVSPLAIPVKEQMIEINSTPRKVIFAHAHSEITYPVKIPQGSLLAFAIGIMPGAWDKIPEGVKFDIEILSDGNTKNIFSRVLQPKRNVGDRGWHNFIISLEKFSGKSVFVVFRTTGSGDDLSYSWSAWGWVKITKKEKAINGENVNTPLAENRLSEVFTSSEERFGNKRGEITRVELMDENLKGTMCFNSGDTAIVRIHFLLHEDIKENVTIGCTFKNKFCDIYGTNTKWQHLDISNRKKDREYIVEFSQSLKINSGIYAINVGLVIVHFDNEIEVLDRRYDCVFFRVEKKDPMVGIVDLQSSLKEIQI